VDVLNALEYLVLFRKITQNECLNFKNRLRKIMLVIKNFSNIFKAEGTKTLAFFPL